MPFRHGEENAGLGSHMIVNESADCDESDDFEKRDVACVCPKCSESHPIKMHWIGRGTPRKFCQCFRNTRYDIDNI